MPAQEPPYRARLVSLATKHAKASACSRPFWRLLGVELVVPVLDTDRLGTFTGEIPRVGSPAEVCVRKARLGMAAAGLPLGLASEGSFGPHPALPFVPADLELLTFVDDVRGLVITERTLAMRTNFSHRQARGVDELADWLAVVGFPAHALIVRPAATVPALPIAKGLASIDALAAAISAASATSEIGVASVETDMRAHCNPTRMAVIRGLAVRLARRLATRCPGCTAPGFGRTGEVIGLPCAWCGSPTDLILRELWGCSACPYVDERPRRDDLVHAEPQHCPVCNP